MHTGITGTTRTFFGRPYTVYPTEHIQSSTHSNHIITFINKIATTPKDIANCFTKHAPHKTNIYTNRETHKIQGYT